MRVLVAGVGNLFLGDDGFGPEVVRQLCSRGDLPAGTHAVDYGIRGLHLSYDLLGGYDALVLVDALPGPGEPGDLCVLEVDEERLGAEAFDPHGMDPTAVLAGLRRFGGTLPPTFVVGCVPLDVEERIGLSETVAAAVPLAVQAVHDLLRDPVLVSAGS